LVVFKSATMLILIYGMSHLVMTIPPASALPTRENLAAEIEYCQRLEAELKSKERILQTFYDSVPMMMGVVELRGEDIFHIANNLATADFLGVNPTGKSARELGIPAEILALWVTQYRESYRTKKPVRFEYLHGDRYLGVIVALLTVEGQEENPHFSYIVQDITEKQSIEKTLELQDIIVKNMAEGICLVRESDCQIVYANPKFEQIFGYESGELAGKPEEILNYEDRMANCYEIREAICNCISVQGECTYEVHSVKKDGTPFWCLAKASCFDHPDYGLVYVVVQGDITATKLAQETLYTSQKRLYHLIKSSPAVTFICEPGGNYGATYISENVVEMLGYASEQFLSDPNFWANRVHPDDRERVFINLQKIFTQDIYSHEYRFLKADGSYCWLLAKLRLIKDENNRPLETLGSLVDISDHKQAEEVIATSLQEKEVLLKEIHHRVKNNLQVICSLLNLQSRAVADEGFKEILMRIKNRIIAMSILHEKLYQSQNIASIKLADYVEDLAKNIVSYYNILPSKTLLKTEIDKSISLDIDTAVPCGLILNELISNSCKYAFESGEQGEIVISGTLDKEQGLCLSVADNGKGLPANFNLENNKTLGLQLVKSLTHQLRGDLKIAREVGTKFEITVASIKAKEQNYAH
jgi:PAS domain S-box-containing protein